MTQHLAETWLRQEAGHLMKAIKSMNETGCGWKVGSSGWLQHKNFLDGELIMVEKVADQLFGIKVGRDARGENE